MLRATGGLAETKSAAEASSERELEMETAHVDAGSVVVVELRCELMVTGREGRENEATTARMSQSAREQAQGARHGVDGSP